MKNLKKLSLKSLPAGKVLGEKQMKHLTGGAGEEMTCAPGLCGGDVRCYSPLYGHITCHLFYSNEPKSCACVPYSKF